MQNTEHDTPSVNWKQVGTFLGLTFGLTFLLDLGLYLTAGYGPNAATSFLLQVQMLIPATAAIVLQLFVFKDSALYHLKTRARWFYYGYLGYVAIHLLLALSVTVITEELYQTLAGLFLQGILLLGLLAVVVLRLASGKETFRQAGLSGGKWWQYLVFGQLIIAVYAAMTGLNALFDLGQAANLRDMIVEAAGGQTAGLELVPDWALLLLVGGQTVVVGPILGLLVAFGEEYGWRGYLQGELVKMGTVRGILLVGVIWGLWHAPIIVMGHNYPGYPVLGPILMTAYTVGLAFLFGYAVLKSGSVWLAAFLHALNNQVASFLMVAVYTPDDVAFSFGIGVYSLIVWAVVVASLLIFDRKAWMSSVKSKTSLEET